ncbi:glycosyltransferase family 4 protein [Exiguobacterium alkaliphilum]|uniref:glycosyltransferase family 4 protein n=1 Tax=Exiguobacterium alkaliphilum TaxID=1428684 RepID=UPI001BA83A0A|nr:glycosyltransferase family 4 protein [Exiguobacterium alkaliphilum]QUE87196.1 glycosyltransferase family 4 protein [Exiguobacterium alkaliphilum]
MKVIILAPIPPPAGGIASWTLRMQGASLKNGWKIEVVDEKLIGDRKVFGKESKINLKKEVVRTFGIWKNLLFKLIDKETRVVHACIPASTNSMLREIGSCSLTKLFRKKFIIHYRCTIPNICTGKINLFLFKILSNMSDSLIVLNKESYNFSIKHSRKRTVIIPNFVENNITESIRFKEISPKISKIVYVGGVIEEKGCNDIIKAAEKLPKIKFHLVGKHDSDFSSNIFLENVVLLGEKNKKEVQEELATSDLFIFPTYFPGEGFSNALVEAMALGLPCVVSDWAANKDMIEDKGGIVVSIKDVQGLVNAINKLNDDPELRKRQSEWNVLKVKNFYNERRIVDLYVDEYEK